MYIPKNKIKENQYTIGKQYIVKSTGKEYIGYYYTLSDGKSFSGKNPQYTPSLELIQYTGLSIQSITDPLIIDYLKLKKNTHSEDILKYKPIPVFYPHLNSKDYDLGVITRYFCKPINGGVSSIKEIEKSVYDSIFYKKGEYDDTLNIVTKVPWTIKGSLNDIFQGEILIQPGVINTNYNQIKLSEINFHGISKYLLDLKEFYK